MTKWHRRMRLVGAHFCLLNLGQDKATARYGYHSLAAILARRK